MASPFVPFPGQQPNTGARAGASDALASAKHDFAKNGAPRRGPGLFRRLLARIRGY